MSRVKPKRPAPQETFRDAVDSSATLRYRTALDAIKKQEGKGEIKPKNTDKVLGSVAIDDDCESTHAHSQAPRWDYVIGYDSSGEAVAYYVEVHAAVKASHITEVERKFNWLRDFLLEERQHKLRQLKPKYCWVAKDGRIKIPQGTPQYRNLQKTLRSRGLQGPMKNLELE